MPEPSAGCYLYRLYHLYRLFLHPRHPYPTWRCAASARLACCANAAAAAAKSSHARIALAIAARTALHARGCMEAVASGDERLRGHACNTQAIATRTALRARGCIAVASGLVLSQAGMSGREGMRAARKPLPRAPPCVQGGARACGVVVGGDERARAHAHRPARTGTQGRMDCCMQGKRTRRSAQPVCR